jgi:hypothetical protein
VELGRRSEAAAEFRSVIDCNPGDPEARPNLLRLQSGERPH